MAGNVWEWLADPAGPDGGYVGRGMVVYFWHMLFLSESAVALLEGSIAGLLARAWPLFCQNRAVILFGGPKALSDTREGMVYPV
jgi:hypothetical protein